MKKTMMIIASCILLLTGCTTRLSQEQLQSMVEVQPMISEPEKVYIPIETIRYVFPDKGMIVDESTLKTSMSDEELVENAAEESVQSVKSVFDFTNTIAEYDFQDGEIYTIITSPTSVTDLRLEPGEEISGDAAIGDPSRWQFMVSISIENGEPVTHLFLRPSVEGLSTTMVIPTNRRTYYLTLRSTEKIYMLGVRFRYPSSFTFSSETSATQSSESQSKLFVSADKIDFNYKIEGKSSLVWKPTAVYSDGSKTYFQMDPRFSTSAGAPALYLLPSKNSSDSKLEVTNYRVQGNMYIVDFVLEDKQAFLLMAFTDSSNKEKVVITRK